eukprot:TRINITY_DN65380_c0_g1_i1.p1 TRINITY_DN65380_c0_g1~~TRINITY_DN65380_c0_g1_i1.p1  ORF type:complete len:726 (-),score=48.46 TRINITY_DN65380_c0_g1_i1:12-2189(-)
MAARCCILTAALIAISVALASITFLRASVGSGATPASFAPFLEPVQVPSVGETNASKQEPHKIAQLREHESQLEHVLLTKPLLDVEIVNDDLNTSTTSVVLGNDASSSMRDEQIGSEGSRQSLRISGDVVNTRLRMGLCVVSSGVLTSSVLHSMLLNVVRPNSAAFAIDVFDSRENGSALPTDNGLCSLASAYGAVSCRAVALSHASVQVGGRAKLHTRDRIREYHRKAVVCLQGVLNAETQTSSEYDQIFIVPASFYWAAPFVMRAEADRTLISAGTVERMNCLGWEGPLRLGRGVVVRLLSNSLSFDRVLTNASDVEIRDVRSMPAAPVQILGGNVPCFHKLHTECYEDKRLSVLFRSLPCPRTPSEMDNLTCADTFLLGARRKQSKLCVHHWGFNHQDTLALEMAVANAAGPSRQPVVLTSVNRGMLDFADNLLCSLRALGLLSRTVVVGLETGVCSSMTVEGISCIDVSRMGQRAPRSRHGSEPLRFGQPEYRELMVAKFAVIALSLLAGVTNELLYLDVDVVVVQDPFDAIAQSLGNDVDLAAQRNSALAKSARTCADVRGRSVAASPYDANAGFLYLRSRPGAVNVILRTVRNMYDGNMGLDGADQGALNEAIKDLSGPFNAEKDIGLASFAEFSCDVFANGDVFFAHQEILNVSKLAGVHATWMVGADRKRECLATAGLWLRPPPGPPPGRRRRWLETRCVPGVVDVKPGNCSWVGVR